MNYRLEGLTKEADDIATNLKEQGLMGCDLEVIGALLFTKYRGEDNRIEKMLGDTSTLIEEANALLEKLRNQIL
jgi:hypothetical protein